VSVLLLLFFFAVISVSAKNIKGPDPIFKVGELPKDLPIYPYYQDLSIHEVQGNAHVTFLTTAEDETVGIFYGKLLYQWGWKLVGQSLDVEEKGFIFKKKTRVVHVILNFDLESGYTLVTIHLIE
jgi:hypothetical protein